MSPAAARLAKAKRIVGRLADDVTHAIELSALYDRCADKKDILSALANSVEAWGFMVVRDALHLELIIVLMRIHGGTSRDDDATLPAATELLSDEAVQAALWVDAKDASLGRKRSALGTPPPPDVETQIRKWREEGAEKDANGALKAARSALRSSKRFQDDDVLRSLKKLRNKRLAHSTLYQGNHGAKVGFARTLLDQTIPVVEKLGRSALRMDFRFGRYRQAWRIKAGYFWRHVAKSPAKGRAKPKRPSKSP